MARLHGPWLVDITASIVTIGLLILFLHIWKPKEVLNADLQVVPALDRLPNHNSFASVRRAALPWLILAIFVTIWGTPHITAWLGAGTTLHPIVQGLHDAVLRMPPASHLPTPEPAIFTFNWLSATGTGIFISAILSAFLMGLKPRDIFQSLWHTTVTTRFTAITIAALMALGFVTRFCGLDATLGLAFARTGVLYPIFGTLIGWLGTASTGSDTSSNVLFGSLQTVTAQQLNISPYLMAAANSGGGVMGKMVAPQSIVVATTATESYGKEGTIMRFVLMHSLGLAFLMGLLVLFAVHTPKFANMLLH
jgi:lactate permease